MKSARSFLTLRDLSFEEIKFLLEMARDFKQHRGMYRRQAPLTGKILVMIFQKRSTRTRVTAELAMSELGGKAIFLGMDDIHLGANESIRDTAAVLGRMSSAILARVYNHEDLEELTKYAGVPVINALSDKFHPLQGLADLLTIETHLETFADKKVAWVGDGNNVCHSLMIACAKMQLEIMVASPQHHEPLEEVVNYCKEIAKVPVEVTNVPKEAVTDADVIVTDTFISMGQEALRSEKLKGFKEFQVNADLVKSAKPDYIFMHCLPRHQEEVTDEIFYGSHSVVFEEAENRLHTITGVLRNLL
ncbi:MAG: ornithine carbamoyltransferase [Candidatus Helarchaeota archaeon]|nr:ornithine carbamoyltransferase [Candidatus Helarchaeota archaeon]